MRFTDRVAETLARRLDRRGFVARAAMGGTALAVAPLEFSLRPGDAYGAICRCNGARCTCGSMCCDGYTEFCCTAFGANRCPPGSVIAGWWKADGSPFCGGGSRYYMDCNAPCGDCGCGPSGLCSGGCSGTGCGCANGDCNNRRVGCVQFRYGQCNQHVPCVGPITCRLVSCVPPWEIEPSCTTTVAVDEGTRFHNAPCLQAGRGSIDVVGVDRRTVRVGGWAIGSDTPAVHTVQIFLNGTPVAEASAGLARADLGPFFPGLGINHGFDLSFQAPPGVHTLSVQAFDPAAPIDRFDIGSRVVGIGVPFGSLDVVGQVPGGVRVAGWMIDPDATGPASVHIYVDDRLAIGVVADRGRGDIAAAFPSYGAAHGFEVVVPAAPGVHTICAYAIDSGGDPNLNRLLACRQVDVRGRPVGNLDVVETAPGGVRVAGWALDPETTASLDVHVYVDGVLAGSGRADRPRGDIAAAYPSHGAAHGFDLVVGADPGRRDVCVYAIDAGSGGAGNPSLGCRNVAVGSAPFGRVDVVDLRPGGIRVAGWAIDPDTSGPIEVHVYVDGALAGSGSANVFRSDIAANFPPYGGAHGFDLVVPAAAGARQVCVYAINTGPGGNSLIQCVTAP